MEHTVLSWMIFFPLIGAALILCLPSRAHGLIRMTGVAATIPPLLMAVWLVRHFDPEHHRAGLPADLAALVSHIDANSVTLTLVNTSPLDAHTVTVQLGAYGEHRCTSIRTSQSPPSPLSGPGGS